ncbi:BCCT family transporter [Nesterenkonia pannonica]|uniref:BCCT family transporter n=1 Tax=Nesterenkonia pannonica TaxID=1548602 RepID=UPI0021646B1E|nr:BCCT family transporter [Nesterenkonia pannonica]
MANIGEYIQIFPQMLFESSMDYAGSGGEGVTEDGGLLGSFSVDWTVYYWGWWMSWAPFVGMFIARISRGRTIREFVLGVLLAPTMVGLLWFSIFGGTGLWFQITEGTMVSYDDEGAAEIGTEESLFLMLEQLPIASIASVIAILIVTLFFITSGDSASLVTDVLSYGGRTETPKLTRTFWTVLIAITAIVLLSAAPDPEASMTVLQMSAIMAAAPLSIVYALAVIAMLRLLLFEGRTSSKYVRVRHHATKAAMVKAAREAAYAENGTAVQRNLLSLLNKQATSLRTLFGGASATLAGLPARSSERKLAEGVANDDLVLAIQDVPGQATTVNTETGVLGWNRELGYRDPLPDTEFDSEEYAQSYEGWESESEEFFDETVATGTIETVEPNTKPKDENSS